MRDDYERYQREEDERAWVFNLACDAEGVPKKARASARKEHWSSVVQQAIPPAFPGISFEGAQLEAARHLVWMFGRVGPEGRNVAEAAARLGGWKAAVDYVVAECARLGPAPYPPPGNRDGHIPSKDRRAA
jgi:hypothetical protein